MGRPLSQPTRLDQTAGTISPQRWGYPPLLYPDRIVCTGEAHEATGFHWPARRRGSLAPPRCVLARFVDQTLDRDFCWRLQSAGRLVFRRVFTRRELGFAEGVDYGLEVRYANGRFDSIPAQMDELVRLKPDIIVSGTMAAAIAAKKLTNTVPIVSVTLVDPIGFGMAASLARPGGNVTGVMLMMEDLPTKLLELALETVPGANSIGLLVNPTNPIHPGLQRSLDVAARAHGVELVGSEASTLDDLYAALQRLARGRVKIVLILQDTMFLNERKRIALFAMAQRLPTIFGFREGVEEGALISYGVNLRESWRRAASFVDKILRFFADCCCEKGAPSGQLEIKTALYLPCPSWATD